MGRKNYFCNSIRIAQNPIWQPCFSVLPKIHNYLRSVFYKLLQLYFHYKIIIYKIIIIFHIFYNYCFNYLLLTNQSLFIWKREYSGSSLQITSVEKNINYNKQTDDPEVIQIMTFLGGVRKKILSSSFGTANKLQNKRKLVPIKHGFNLQKLY